MKTSTLLSGASALLAFSLSSCSPFTLVDSQVYNNANLADYHTFRIISPQTDSLPPGMEEVTYYNIAAAIREQMVDRGYQEDPFSPMVINIGITESTQYQTESLGSLMAPPPPPQPVPVIVVPRPTPPPPPPSPSPGGPMPSPEPSPQAVAPPPAPAPSHFFYPRPGPRPAFAPYFMMPRGYYWNNGINPNSQVVTGVYKEGVLTMDIIDMRTRMPLYSASVATIMDNGNTQFRNLKGIAEAVQTLFSKFPVPLLPQYRNNK